MPEMIRYRDLIRLLLRHGFEAEGVTGPHRLFVHSASDTKILLPSSPLTDMAMPAQIVSVRRLLDERGLLPEDRFETEVRSSRNGHVRSRS